MCLVVQHPSCAFSLRFFCQHFGCRQAGCGQRCCGRGGCETHACVVRVPATTSSFKSPAAGVLRVCVRCTDVRLFPQAQRHAHCWGGHVAQDWSACTLMSISVAVVGMYSVGRTAGRAQPGQDVFSFVCPTLCLQLPQPCCQGACCRCHLPSVGAGSWVWRGWAPCAAAPWHLQSGHECMCQHWR